MKLHFNSECGSHMGRTFFLLAILSVAVFTVAACGGGGGEGGGGSSPAVPVAPTGVTAVAGPGEATINWSPVAGATLYNIYYSTSTGVTKTSGIKIVGATSPSIVAGLTSGTAYYFVVTAINSIGESVESGQVSATPTFTPPVPPTGVLAVAGHGEATISWNVVANAASYNIYWSTTPGVTKTTGNKLAGVVSPRVVTGLVNGTTYYFVVTAVNVGGESPESSQVSATPTPAPPPPAPAGVSAAAGHGEVTIGWNVVAGATSYNIYWSTTPGVTKATGAKIPGFPNPKIVTGLTNGTTYYFVVTAENVNGESPESSQVSATPTPAPPPPAPTGVSAAAGYGLVTINWSPVVGATSYNIYYSTVSPVTKATGIKIAGVTSPRVVNGLNIGTVYYFVVTSVNVDGESAESSPVSARVSAEYIAVGDSITFGEGDNIPSDGIGYEPILANLLAATVANEGVGGVKSAYGAANISSTLSKYPTAKYFLILYGTNDADITSGSPVPSGLGLNPGDAGYNNSYKYNMQQIISAVKASGKFPYLAKVPYNTTIGSSDAAIQEYNAVIVELVAANGISVTPPDFYTHFKNHPGELADGLHPNGVGYQSMANLWNIALP